MSRTPRTFEGSLSGLKECKSGSSSRKKCEFGFSELCFLGYVVGNETIKPMLSKAIQDFSVPTTKIKVKSFLELNGFYRKFIPNFALPTPRARRHQTRSSVQDFDRTFKKVKGMLLS